MLCTPTSEYNKRAIDLRFLEHRLIIQPRMRVDIISYVSGEGNISLAD